MAHLGEAGVGMQIGPQEPRVGSGCGGRVQVEEAFCRAVACAQSNGGHFWERGGGVRGLPA